MRRRSFDFTAGPNAKPISIPNKLIAGKTPDEELLGALASLYPRRELPTSLSVGYLHTPEPARRSCLNGIDDALGLIRRMTKGNCG